MEIKVDKLKPCPYCGNAERPRYIETWEVNGDDADVGGWFIICCAKAGAPGCGASSGWGSTEAEVTEAWNRRATVPEGKATVGGEWMEQTIQTHMHRAEHYIAIEQAKILPDNALVAVLCDSVRLCREYVKAMASSSPRGTCGDAAKGNP